MSSLPEGPEADRADDASERIPGRAAEPAPCRESPVEVDVRILQSGSAIGRLRLAGLCDGRGQFDLCRFKTFTTKLKSRFPPVEQDLGRP